MSLRVKLQLYMLSGGEGRKNTSQYRLFSSERVALPRWHFKLFESGKQQYSRKSKVLKFDRQFSPIYRSSKSFVLRRGSFRLRCHTRAVPMASTC